MLDFDDTIKKEMYFDKQEIKDTAKKPFKALLVWVTNALKDGKPIKQIKKYIAEQDVDKNLKENLLTSIKQQQKIITGKDKGFNLAQVSVAGLTFTESIKQRKDGIKKRAVRYMAGASELIKAEESTKNLLDDEVTRFSRDTETFWKTQTKSAREYSYQERENSSKKEILLALGITAGATEIKGWISVAILDNRTSVICASLNNMFYPKEEYLSRAEIPNKPPRHPRCRSVILPVYREKDIKKYENQDLETFMRRNPKVAKDFMGDKKYEMWSKGKVKINKYIDMDGQRFYTNDEIVDRLGIKR